jgi:anti-sigma-K factor RskA
MDHIEPDELAVLALDGLAPEAAVRAHLDACDMCASEYAALERTVDLGRDVPSDALEAPPAAVWARIHGELGLSPDLAADPFAESRRQDARTRAVDAQAADAQVADAQVADAPTAIAAQRHVPPRRSRTPGPASPASPAARPARARRRSWWPIVAVAAVVGLFAGVGIGVALGGIGARTDATTVLASAELDAFPGWDAVGTATVEEDSAGERTVVVDLAAQVPEGEVREVWLIRSDASGLVSLGLMDGDSARLAVPADIDLDEYPLVDVSAEPIDGDPAHSGDSIVRGELSAA